MRVLPMDFMGQGALLQPVNQPLHDAAVKFCAEQLSEEVNLSRFTKVWVAEHEGKILGISGYVMKPDIPVCRAIDAQALRLLGKRMNDFFADSGALGSQVFMHIGREKPEQRCPEWRQVLKEFGAQSANRVAFIVR